MAILNNKTPNINDFLEAYSRALEAHDTKAMAFMYNIPCIMLSDEATTNFSDASKLEGFFNQGVAFYRQFGIVANRANVWNKQQLSKKVFKVKVHWEYLDANNKLVYDCDYEYIIKLDKGNNWRIMLSVSINEKERMEAWMKANQEPATLA